MSRTQAKADRPRAATTAHPGPDLASRQSRQRERNVPPEDVSIARLLRNQLASAAQFPLAQAHYPEQVRCGLVESNFLHVLGVRVAVSSGLP